MESRVFAKITCNRFVFAESLGGVQKEGALFAGVQGYGVNRVQVCGAWRDALCAYMQGRGVLFQWGASVWGACVGGIGLGGRSVGSELCMVLCAGAQ